MTDLDHDLDHDLEQKLKDLAAATAPANPLVTRVMQRVNEARPPQRRILFRLLAAPPVVRASVAAVVAVAAGVAVIAAALHAFRPPNTPAPLVEVQKPSPDVLAVRVLDIRRIDFRSTDSLDALLREGASAPSRDTVIRAAELSRPDLDLYQGK